MPAKTPYTYRRADGTYYARFLIPKRVRACRPELPRECRFSLRCRSKFEADQTVVRFRHLFHRKIEILADTRSRDRREVADALAWLKQPTDLMTDRMDPMQYQYDAYSQQPAPHPVPGDQQGPLNLSEITLPNGITIRIDHGDRELEQADVLTYLEKYLHLSGGNGGGTHSGTPPSSGQTVHQVTEAYIADYRDEGGANDRSADQTVKRIRRVMALLGSDRRFCELTREDIQAVRAKIRELPDARCKSKRGQTAKTLSHSTAIEHFQLLKNVCTFAVEIDAHTKDIGKKVFMRTPKSGPEAKSKRPGFTQDDIRKIFSGYIYTMPPLKRAENLYPYHFWLPLLYAFTGTRRNEMCQLRVCDVVYAESVGIWYLNVADEGENQNLKTPQSTRPLPVHDTLIQLGFIDFVKERQASAKPGDQLFEGLYYSPSNGWGKKFGDWFLGNGSRKSYLATLGLEKPEGKVVHSFRHTTVTVFRRARTQKIDIDTIIGHLNESTQAMYGEYELEPLRDIINKIEYGVDLSHLSYAAFKDYMKRRGKPPSSARQ